MLRDLLAVVVRSLTDLPFLLVTAQRPDPDIVWPPNVDRPLVVQVPLGSLGREDATVLVRACSNGASPVASSASRRSASSSIAAAGTPVPRRAGRLAASCPRTPRCPAHPCPHRRGSTAARSAAGHRRQRLVLGSGDTIDALHGSPRRWGRSSAGDLAELAADGLFDVDGKVALPQRRRSRGRLPDAHEAVRAQRHAAVAAVSAERGHNIDDVAHHAATAQSCSSSSVLSRSPAVDQRAAVTALLERRRRPSRRDVTNRPSATPAGPSISTAPIRRPSASCCWCGPAPSSSSGGSPRRRPTPSGCSMAPSPMMTRCRKGRHGRLGTIAQMQGDLPTARRELAAAVELFRTVGDQRRLANALRTRGFAEVFGGSPTMRGRSSARRWSSSTPSTTSGARLTHQNLAWVAFQSGDFDDAEVQLIEARERFEGLGDRTGMSWANGLQAWVSPPAPIRRRRGAGAVGRGRRPAVGRHLAGADDADPAGEPAPVDGSARRAEQAAERALAGSARSTTATG